MANARREKGYVLITTALLMVAIVGVSGLSFDIGRMYIARNEAQAFADSAALAAAKTLNGTSAGLTMARDAALSVTNQHNFSTQSFAGTVVEFGPSRNGPWEAVPASGAGITFARVIARAPTNIYLMRVAGVASTSSPGAVAVAGQVPQTVFRDGLFPFTPYVLNMTGPAFGMAACTTTPNCEGSHHALRWPPGAINNPQAMSVAGNGSPTGNVCGGDMGSMAITSAQTADADLRGFYDPFGNANDQRQMIVNDIVASPLDITVGTNIPMTGGQMQTQADAIQERVNQDTDPVSRTYQQYLQRLDNNGRRVGNGRRVIGVPMNSGPPNFTTMAIAGFFLLTENWYDVNAPQSLCAEYIGPFTLGAGTGGGASTGSFVVRLVQ